MEKKRRNTDRHNDYVCDFRVSRLMMTISITPNFFPLFYHLCHCELFVYILSIQLTNTNARSFDRNAMGFVFGALDLLG